MEYSQAARIEILTDICLAQTSADAAEIFYRLAASDALRMHGPEHHFADGAALLTAFYNAGGPISLKPALSLLAAQSDRMPGAICGLWGICGAAASVGAALAIIEGTGPLTDDGSWGENMQCTAQILLRIGDLKGPRCCKRDGLIALCVGAEQLARRFSLSLSCHIRDCAFYEKNSQCIKTACPFWPKGNICLLPVG